MQLKDFLKLYKPASFLMAAASECLLITYIFSLPFQIQVQYASALIASHLSWSRCLEGGLPAGKTTWS
jgi:hypothetical protein